MLHSSSRQGLPLIAGHTWAACCSTPTTVLPNILPCRPVGPAVVERGVLPQARLGSGFKCDPLLPAAVVQTCISLKYKTQAS